MAIFLLFNPVLSRAPIIVMTQVGYWSNKVETVIGAMSAKL